MVRKLEKVNGIDCIAVEIVLKLKKMPHLNFVQSYLKRVCEYVTNKGV